MTLLAAAILTSDSPPGLSDFAGPAGAAPVFQILKGFQGRSPCLAFQHLLEHPQCVASGNFRHIFFR
jgi:hypothetical protein